MIDTDITVCCATPPEAFLARLLVPRARIHLTGCFCPKPELLPQGRLMIFGFGGSPSGKKGQIGRTWIAHTVKNAEDAVEWRAKANALDLVPGAEPGIFVGADREVIDEPAHRRIFDERGVQVLGNEEHIIARVAQERLVAVVRIILDTSRPKERLGSFARAPQCDGPISKTEILRAFLADPLQSLRVTRNTFLASLAFFRLLQEGRVAIPEIVPAE